MSWLGRVGQYGGIGKSSYRKRSNPISNLGQCGGLWQTLGPPLGMYNSGLASGRTKQRPGVAACVLASKANANFR